MIRKKINPEKIETPPEEDRSAPTGYDNLKLQQQGWGPGLGQNMDVGDAYVYTVGKETFFPVKCQGYEVGPIQVTVHLREGEGLEDMVKRAAQFANQVWEAEFSIKKKQFFQRLAESGEDT